jgi:hypothetical protein
MAKELALVENNERGRAIRKYFIAVEKRAREAAMQTGKTAGLPEGDAVFELIGIIRSQAAAIENLAKETPASRRSGAVAAPAILAGKSDAVGEWINTTQLAALYGKTRATCLSHARAMGWAMRVSRLETGSLTYEFLLASLPEKIQAAWKEQKEATVPIM